MGRFDRTARGGSAPEPLELVLTTRRDCPLCEELEEALEDAGLEGRYTLVRRDVDRDPELLRAYGRRVPVLELAGEVLAEGRTNAQAVREAFERRARTLARRP